MTRASSSSRRLARSRRRIAVPSSTGERGLAGERQIVGVIGNTRFVGPHTRPVSEVYLPYAQSPWNVLHVIVESDAPEARNIATLHAALRALRPDLAVEPVESLSMIVSRGVRNWRFGAWLLSVFVALAVVLAAIGLMTTMGWWVHARTLEIGVPIALGATRRQLTRLVLGQGLALGVAGIMAGCATAAGVTRYMERWFYGVPPLDPATFAACALAMLLVAGLALLLPVRRATTVDPIVALRAE